MEMTLTATRTNVFEEVAKTTAYTGSKAVGDETAYERMLAKDADREMLARFWEETCADACDTLRRLVVTDEDDGETFSLTLALSASFDTALERSIQKDFFSYFVLSVTGKWFAIANKEEAGGYGKAAADTLLGLHRKALLKRRPQRPEYN